MISLDAPVFFSKIRASRKLPVLLQAESAECGLVCVAMIASYFGHSLDVIGIRQRINLSSRGIDITDLLEIAETLNLSGRAVRLELNELKDLETPCILHWGMSHFVVLKSVTKNAVFIHDPAQGERRVPLNQVDRMFTGVAIEFMPTSEFEMKSPDERISLAHFWSRIVGLKRSLAKILLLSFLLEIYVVFTPFFFQTVVDQVIDFKDLNLLHLLVSAFGLLLFLQTVTGLLREYVIMHLSSHLHMQMGANLFRHLIRLPLEYFSKRHMGDVVSRFASIASIRQLLTTGLVTAFVDGLMAIITLIAMAIYSLKLTAIVVSVLTLYILFRFVTFRPIRFLTEESIVAKAKENSNFMETVRAIQTIKIFQKENIRQARWQGLLVDSISTDIRLSKWYVQFGAVSILLMGGENILTIYFGAHSVMEDTLSLGMLYAFFGYKINFITSMEKLIHQWIEFKMIGLHFDRLADIISTPAEASKTRDIFLGDITEDSPNYLQGNIEARNLGFSYGKTDSFVFRNLSFTIEPGETVAIIGPSGCGKTTLLKCLMGLLKPTEGEILIDGKSLSNHDCYRKQIVAVMQDDQLLSGTIADNIACFSPHINLEKIVACARKACIEEEIQNMPMKYQTLVGDMGNDLSGGQKQRIVLARALYHEPRILFMDEATSHLDVAGERKINRFITDLAITRVMVAHRPETVESAGRQITLVGDLAEQ